MKSIISLFIPLLIASGFVLPVTAASKDTKTVESVQITPSHVSLTAGRTVQYVIDITYSDGTTERGHEPSVVLAHEDGTRENIYTFSSPVTLEAIGTQYGLHASSTHIEATKDVMPGTYYVRAMAGGVRSAFSTITVEAGSILEENPTKDTSEIANKPYKTPWVYWLTIIALLCCSSSLLLYSRKGRRNRI